MKLLHNKSKTTTYNLDNLSSTSLEVSNGEFLSKSKNNILNKSTEKPSVQNVVNFTPINNNEKRNNYNINNNKNFSNLSSPNQNKFLHSFFNVSHNLNMFGNNNNDNMKVMVRIRPPLEREIEFGVPFRSICEISNNNTMVTLFEYLGSSVEELDRQHDLINNPCLFSQHRFTFDYIFDTNSDQNEVYIKAAQKSVLSVLEGYNSTIFAYGQTGTGKTYTMEGFTYDPLDEKRGIVPRSMEEIFSYIEKPEIKNYKFIIRASYLQIYNEYIYDLLKPERKNLNIREDRKRGIYVDNLSEWIVRKSSDIYDLLEQGAENRATSSTLLNEVSSRSHGIFIITVEQMSTKNDGVCTTKTAKLNLVDLAGSERIRITNAKGKQLEESKRINKSLSCLGNVINALTDQKGITTHVPYRDSKLTRLLEDSLGGNCKTTMITNISPCQDFFSETLSSLLFAKRAKRIKNKPKINQDVNHRTLISQYEIQLNNLREELSKKNELLNSNNLLIQLEQANNDKKEIIKQLELTSKNYLKERDAKRELENKIQLLQSQLIYGGNSNNNINNSFCKENNKDLGNTSQIKKVLEERQNVLLKEFNSKLKEYEKEINKKEDKKNNEMDIDRYKNLFLKQRDLMLSLTTKLNDRDETIIQLQEESDIYENLNNNLENNNIELNKKIKKLSEICKQNNLISEQEYSEYINNKKINKNYNNVGKKYIPYQNEKNKENLPNILLTADEKIKELKNIIKEQDNEINILKLVSKKFLASSYEKLSLEDLLKSFKNNFELHTKIRDIEQEKQLIKSENNQLIEEINSLKNENDSLNDKLNKIYMMINENKDIINNNNYEKLLRELNFNQMFGGINELTENRNNRFKIEVNTKTVNNTNNRSEFITKLDSKKQLKESNNLYNKTINNESYKQFLYGKITSDKNTSKFLNKFINADK